MSYNIFSKNASFKGDISGTIENQVNDWDNQTIAGNKTFTNPITSSADVMLSGSGKVSASFYYGDGSNLTGVGQNAAGSDREVQFNDGGTNFGASSNFTFTAANELQVSGQISASLGISGSEFHGDGSNLTAVTASFVTASNVNGVLNASQVNLGEGLEDNSNAIRVKLDSNSGIQRSGTGISLDIDSLNDGAYSDARTIAIGSSGTTEKITISVLEANMNISGSKIVGAGSIPNSVLQTTIDRPILSASTGISGAFFQGDGSGLTGVTGAPTPAGANTQIQFNDDGALAGNAAFTFLTGSGTITTTILSASSHVSASSYGGVIGTLIDSEANFAGNNASFNEISASGIISSSNDVFATSFHGDGHTLNNVPLVSSSANGIVFIDNHNQKTITSHANLTYNTDLTLANGDIIVSSGNVTASGHVSASTYFGDASNLTNIPAGSPAGANTQIQLNADGAFGATSKFTFSTSSATLEIGKSSATSNESRIWFHSGSNEFGAGSGSFIESDGDNHFVFDNNTIDADIRFVTRADSGAPSNEYIKLLIDGSSTSKGVGIGNVSGMGIQDLYVSNTNLTSHTNIKFENRDLYDVILKLSSSTAETTLTNDRSTADFTLSHEGGDISVHSSNNLNLSASSNIGITGSTGLIAEFDSGSGYLFKATKLHYKEVACQLNSSLSAGVAVFIPFIGTTDSVTQNFTHKFVAPFSGQIVKIMIRLDNTLGTTSSTLKVLKASDGTEHPTSVMETETLNFAAAGGYSANNTLTANFTSATFSSGDALGISFTPQGSPSTNIDLNMTIVFAYDELS